MACAQELPGSKNTGVGKRRSMAVLVSVVIQIICTVINDY